eukprot:GHVH01002141.1.p1 GENE.GHVH01002141.1~~GHVH01002141.1.p1  ORF type:complete len:277 (+),score=30.81 GHVH01002141.1:29-859(+)
MYSELSSTFASTFASTISFAEDFYPQHIQKKAKKKKKKITKRIANKGSNQFDSNPTSKNVSFSRCNVIVSSISIDDDSESSFCNNEFSSTGGLPVVNRRNNNAILCKADTVTKSVRFGVSDVSMTDRSISTSITYEEDRSTFNSPGRPKAARSIRPESKLRYDNQTDREASWREFGGMAISKQMSEFDSSEYHPSRSINSLKQQTLPNDEDVALSLQKQWSRKLIEADRENRDPFCTLLTWSLRVFRSETASRPQPLLSSPHRTTALQLTFHRFRV